MKLFLTLVCCLTIPFVARAADQNDQTKKKQTTQGQQQKPQQQQHQQLQQHQQHQQARMQGEHNGANTASQLNNPSQLKGHGQHRVLNAQDNSATPLQSNSNRGLTTRHSNSNGGLTTRHHGANTAAQPNNPSQLKGQNHHQGLNARNNNVPAVQANNNGRVESRHFNLSNSPNARIQSTTFHPNYRIQGSENWQGQNYVAFHNYRGEWHDQGWWHNHYNRIVLISGGWYFWNAGYWAPAWGYDTHASYYPYNGPIYAYNNLPPDQVIANVQSTLQAQGYYRGEIDGMLGPMTRAALASYQGDHGLYTTEAIDEPTLDSLGMS